jgi:hypothetical protein
MRAVQCGYGGDVHRADGVRGVRGRLKFFVRDGQECVHELSTRLWSGIFCEPDMQGRGGHGVQRMRGTELPAGLGVPYWKLYGVRIDACMFRSDTVR